MSSQATTISADSAQIINECCGCGTNATTKEVSEGKDERGVYYYCEGCALSQGCSACGAVATTEVEDRNGGSCSLCDNCEVWLRETEAELADLAETLRGQECQDCRHEPATHRFLHMHKGEFFLCASCFTSADHDDDYLERCDCAWPEGEPGQTNCDLCRRELRQVQFYCSCEAPVTNNDLERVDCRACYGRIRFGAPKPQPLCECPLPCIVDGNDSYCFFCSGHIVHLTDEETDAIRRRESS